MCLDRMQNRMPPVCNAQCAFSLFLCGHAVAEGVRNEFGEPTPSAVSAFPDE